MARPAGGGTYSCPSAVSSPICVGIMPVRLLLLNQLLGPQEEVVHSPRPAAVAHTHIHTQTF